MARSRTEPPPEAAPEPTDEERERQEAESRLRATQTEPAPPRPLSPLPDDVAKALGEPLDRSRVKSRQGRGNKSYDYLETHEVKRTANRIFGFGGWGYRVLEQERIGEQQIEKENQGGSKTAGWHIGYRCRVEVTVVGCPPTEGTGYGDGVEYGPAARITASELAIKESESDALKRAFTRYGDQFGLILYAKGDDQARLERDQNADVARETRRETPMSMQEALGRLTAYVEDGAPWVTEAVNALHPGLDFEVGKQSTLDQTQRIDLLKRLQVVVYALESGEADVDDAEAAQRAVRAAFSAAFDGMDVKGPEPFRGRIPF